MKKLDGIRLGDKKSLILQKKIAYIAEEVGDCQISDQKSHIFNKKIAYFKNKKNAYFQRNLLLNMKRSGNSQILYSRMNA